MFRFIVVTLGFLGWAFFELSGGTEFEPRVRPDVAQAEVREVVPVGLETDAPQVSRAASARDGLEADLPEPQSPALQNPAEIGVKLAALDTAVTRGDADAGTRTDAVTLRMPYSVVTAGEPEVEERQPDIRSVTGNRVNMRNGPGTNYSVIDRLTRGTEVEVLQEPGNQWVKLRVLDTNRVGWMADWLITAAAE